MQRRGRTIVLGLLVLLSAIVGRSWPTAAAAPHAGAPHSTGKYPLAPSITIDYR